MHVNIIQPNYTKCAINNITTVHMKAKVRFFKKNGKIMLKKAENAKTCKK